MTSARRFLPSDPADFLRAIVPLALLALAAAIPATRLIVTVPLVAGTAVAIGRERSRSLGLGRRHPRRAEPVLGGMAGPDPGRRRGRLRGSRLAHRRSGAPSRPPLVLGVLAVLAMLLGATPDVAGPADAGSPVCALGRHRIPRDGPRRPGHRAAPGPAVLRADRLRRDGHRGARPGARLRDRQRRPRGGRPIAARSWAGPPGSWASGPRSSARLSCSGSPIPGPDVGGSPLLLMLALGLGGLIAGAITDPDAVAADPDRDPRRVRHPALLRARLRLMNVQPRRLRAETRRPCHHRGMTQQFARVPADAGDVVRQVRGFGGVPWSPALPLPAAAARRSSRSRSSAC